MAAHLGAHEVMEAHEALCMTIDGINQFQMLRPLIRDQRLQSIADNQLRFMTQEYNNLVQMFNQQGMGQAVPYRSPRYNAPVYGLDNPSKQNPNTTPEQLDDRDISSMMLMFHKASATMKMHGALECADPALRHAMQQSAINCAEQAYEVWQFMNQSGYYQVPTMKEMTTNTIIGTYQQGSVAASGTETMNTTMNTMNTSGPSTTYGQMTQ